ncbi:MAG: hypothetical protein ACTS4X_00375 [Candidatus Hodgkinia cicadicola]
MLFNMLESGSNLTTSLNFRTGGSLLIIESKFKIPTNWLPSCCQHIIAR